MAGTTSERGAFVVRILNTDNATWQGTVTWTEGKKTISFRSALELLRLIDGAVQTNDTDTNGVDTL